MTLRDIVAGGPGRVKEYAKIGLRNQLYRRNLDLVRHPYPARVAEALHWLSIDSVLDVGANIGQFGAALRSSGFGGRIVSCEPLPDAFAHLARRCASDARWTALNAAVGGAPGTLEINVAANSYSSSLRTMTDAHLGAAPGSHTIRVESVAVTTVAAVAAEHGLPPASTLLKVDTQGYESEVLDGAGELAAQFGAVQLEMSLVPLYAGQQLADALTARLAGLGFSIYALEGGFGDERTGRMLQYDALFVRTDRLPDVNGGRP
jgi:FkbM family methyltransferase